MADTDFLLTKEHFIKSFEQRSQVIGLLVFLRDHYQLDLNDQHHRDFLIALYYFNINKQPFREHFKKLTEIECAFGSDIKIQSSNNPTGEESSSNGFIIPEHCRPGAHIISSQVLPGGNNINIDDYLENADSLSLKENLKKQLKEQKDFTQIQKLYDKAIIDLLGKKQLPQITDSKAAVQFYEEFEGVANYLLNKYKQKTPEEAINKSSFFDSRPGLLRNFRLVQLESNSNPAASQINPAASQINQVFRSGGLIETKNENKSVIELTIEGLAALTGILVHLKEPKNFVITSLLSSNVSKHIQAEQDAVSLLNTILQKLQQPPLDEKTIHTTVSTSIKDHFKIEESSNLQLDLLLNVIKDNLNDYYKKYPAITFPLFKHINIGENISDVYQQRSQTVYNLTHIEEQLKSMRIQASTDPINIEEAQALITKGGRANIIQALLIREYLRDKVHSSDIFGSRFFYAGLFQYALHQQDKCDILFHCESGKDRTSVVAAVMQLLSNKDDDALKALYTDPSKKEAFMSEIQQSLLNLEKDTQIAMADTESGMQGIKAGSFNDMAGAQLLERLSSLEWAHLISFSANIFNIFVIISASLRELLFGQKSFETLSQERLKLDKVLSQEGLFLKEQLSLIGFIAQDMRIIGSLVLKRFKDISDLNTLMTALLASLALFIRLLIAVAHLFIAVVTTVLEGLAWLCSHLPTNPFTSLFHAMAHTLNKIFIQSFYQQVGLVHVDKSLSYIEAFAAANTGRSNRKKIGALLSKNDNDASSLPQKGESNSLLRPKQIAEYIVEKNFSLNTQDRQLNIRLSHEDNKLLTSNRDENGQEQALLSNHSTKILTRTVNESRHKNVYWQLEDTLPKNSEERLIQKYCEAVFKRIRIEDLVRDDIQLKGLEKEQRMKFYSILYALGLEIEFCLNKNESCDDLDVRFDFQDKQLKKSLEGVWGSLKKSLQARDDMLSQPVQFIQRVKKNPVMPLEVNKASHSESQKNLKNFDT